MSSGVRESVSRGAKRGRSAAAGAFFLLAILLGTGPTPRAWAADQDDVLEACGIRFPGGFDVNTLGEVRGKAADVVQPQTGPVRFRLDAERDSYTVLAAPRWYWGDLKVDLADGAEVVVRGSKTVGTDGRLYIVAQELRVASTGRIVLLRDRGGAPLWAGSRPAGQGGGRGGMGGTGAMGGGMGGGMGGMGRGGRR